MSDYVPTRAVMNREELASQEVGRHGRDYRYSDDGYGDIAVAEKVGWKAISGWGRDGWDLGDWPYVVISARLRDGKWQARQTVEGDTTVWQFDSVEDMQAAIDYLFAWYAAGKRWNDFDREALDNGTQALETKFRGPYDWKRSSDQCHCGFGPLHEVGDHPQT